MGKRKMDGQRQKIVSQWYFEYDWCQQTGRNDKECSPGLIGNGEDHLKGQSRDVVKEVRYGADHAAKGKNAQE
jgi:hypothetical protein